MVELRFWKPEDLPQLRWYSAINAWQLLSEEDRRVASIGQVAQSGEMNLLGVLRSPGGTAIVATNDGTPVGYMLVAVRPEEHSGIPVGYLADIYIEPAYQKQGLAAVFHAAGEHYLTSIGVRKATLWTHAHNSPAHKSATKRGYALRSVMMAKDLQAQ